ncbi:protein adenylyltransferase SelO family protein [Alphaproteobacteria bacterium LSUCC0684]
MGEFIPKRNHLYLSRDLFRRVKAASFPETLICYQNLAWAERLGLGELASNNSEWCRRFARFEGFPGSFKAPLALAYHGHQFGVYNPEIGDGRGFLYAQMEDPVDGRLLDFGTKGSGLTPFSRTADGRLTLKGAVREILATEMLDALGVNTSKTFSVIETGEKLQRNDEPSPTRSAVLVRLSHGHIRIGSFQRLAYNGDKDRLVMLLQYAAHNYYPAIFQENMDDAALAEAFVGHVGGVLAELAASWMAAGFVHGVLNTDNFNISGESFDYGPWRFLPKLDPGFTAAYFDHQGRYAYGRQPEATFWALCRLADCFVDITGIEAMQKSVSRYQEKINGAMIKSLCRRLGIDETWDEAEAMSETFFKTLKAEDINFESVFFDWYGGAASRDRAYDGPRGSIYKSPGFEILTSYLGSAPTKEGATPDHPYFSRTHPVTMLIDEVEAIWAPIAREDDWSFLAAKIEDIHQMSEACGLATTKPKIRIGL